jgi:hypothetical protein
MLDVWPALPIVIKVINVDLWRLDDIISTLEHNDRIYELNIPEALASQLNRILPAMQQSFPALTRLELGCGDETTPVQPDSFLGGSAPRLQYLILDRIPFPGLSKLLLSATRLVALEIWMIPLYGYISPAALVTALTVLTRLEYFDLLFQSPLFSLTRKTDAYLRKHSFSSPVSRHLTLRGPASIWRTSSSRSTPLYSTNL